jgi:Ca2+-binding RTX toxin-like protein
VTGTGNLDRLTLREVGSQGSDGLGALLDNVRLVASGGTTPAPTVPTPTPTSPAAIVGDDLDNVLRGTSSNDRIEGRGGNDSLLGETGDDQLSGGNGNDVLNGAAGNDRLEGGHGSDTYVLGASGDTVVEALNAGTDKVRAAYSYTLGSNIENLQLTGTAAITGTGNELDNVLGGNTGANLLQGMAGNDRILGGQGNDRLLGGVGEDRLNGGEGADHLLGGAGRDILTGGAGDDVFVFNSRAEAGDIITDFSNVAGNNDVFRISAAGFGGGLVAGGTLAASQFQSRGDNFAQDSNDRFIFRTTDKTLWFDADGRGGSAAVMIADLQADATLTSADLLLV